MSWSSGPISCPPVSRTRAATPEERAAWEALRSLSRGRPPAWWTQVAVEGVLAGTAYRRLGGAPGPGLVRQWRPGPVGVGGLRSSILHIQSVERLHRGQRDMRWGMAPTHERRLRRRRQRRWEGQCSVGGPPLASHQPEPPTSTPAAAASACTALAGTFPGGLAAQCSPAEQGLSSI